jgi:chromosome partitioning protein
MQNLISNGIKKLVDSGPEYARGNRAGRVLAIATVKGGVGKTTTAVNLACGLATLEEARVLLIDLDAQGHCASSLSAYDVEASGAEPLSEILLDDEQERQALDSVTSTGIDNLDMTPADPQLAEAEGRIAQKIAKETRLHDALEITRTHYDYVLIDCPPNKGNLTLNGLIAADRVLIPTDLSPLSVQGADELMGTVVTINQRLDHDLDVLGVLLTRVDKRTSSVNEDVLETIDEAWGELVLETEIGINSKLKKSQLAGEPIFEYAPDSRGADHYEALVEEVVDLME